MLSITISEVVAYWQYMRHDCGAKKLEKYGLCGGSRTKIPGRGGGSYSISVYGGGAGLWEQPLCAAMPPPPYFLWPLSVAFSVPCDCSLRAIISTLLIFIIIHPLRLKGSICHFVKWRIHIFIQGDEIMVSCAPCRITLRRHLHPSNVTALINTLLTRMTKTWTRRAEVDNGTVSVLGIIYQRDQGFEVRRVVTGVRNGQTTHEKFFQLCFWFWAQNHNSWPFDIAPKS